MLVIKSLENETRLNIYNAFCAAFSDYVVPLSLSYDEFIADNTRRAFNASLSLGAYDEGVLVGFVLNGRGLWKTQDTAYDLGTGIIPAYRGLGLGTQLAEATKKTLYENGIKIWLLEVIRENEAAVKTYTKAGFKITRNLECFEGTIKSQNTLSKLNIEIKACDQIPYDSIKNFNDFEPSWQNSNDAVKRFPGKLQCFIAYLNNKEIGFCILSASGTIWQLAVEQSNRRQGVGSALLKACASPTNGKLRYINVDASDIGTIELLEKNGIKKDVGQYEMEYYF